MSLPRRRDAASHPELTDSPIGILRHHTPEFGYRLIGKCSSVASVSFAPKGELAFGLDFQTLFMLCSLSFEMPPPVAGA